MSNQPNIKRFAPPPPEFTLARIRNAIPAEYFKQDTARSLYYMARDLAQVALFHYIMSSFIVPLLNNSTSQWMTGVTGFLINFVVWNVFWFFQGLNFTGLWVLAHEAGHQAFSPSKTVNELVGFVLHTALLVPYHSWRVSHGNHHKFTNHLTQDTVFVPRGLPAPLKEAIEESPIVSFGQFLGMLLFGWPAYLSFNVASQTYDRRCNHFEPSSPIFKKSDKWGVIISDIGLIAFIAMLGVAVNKFGFMSVVCYYGVPYLWTNAWLVYITFMQHHDLRIPYYTNENFNFVRGALCSIDRDYGIANAWLHHINDSHVVHHLFSDMPFYNAIEVTRKYIKPILGEYYASDKRPMAVQTMESWRKCLYVVPSEGITYFRN